MIDPRQSAAADPASAALTEHLRTRRHQNEPLEKWLRRPDTDWTALCELDPSLREWAALPPADMALVQDHEIQLQFEQ